METLVQLLFGHKLHVKHFAGWYIDNMLRECWSDYYCACTSVSTSSALVKPERKCTFID